MDERQALEAMRNAALAYQQAGRDIMLRSDELRAAKENHAAAQNAEEEAFRAMSMAAKAWREVLSDSNPS